MCVQLVVECNISLNIIIHRPELYETLLLLLIVVYIQSHSRRQIRDIITISSHPNAKITKKKVKIGIRRRFRSCFFYDSIDIIIIINEPVHQMRLWVFLPYT